MRESLRIVEIVLDQSAPWRSKMRATNDDGTFDITFPYDERFGIGQFINVEITEKD